MKSSLFMFTLLLTLFCLNIVNAQTAIAQAPLSNNSLLQGLETGNLNLGTVAGSIAESAGIPVSQATTILSNIQGDNIEFESAVQLLDAVTNQQISGAVGEILSQIPSLGNITDLSSIGDILQQAVVTNSLNAIMASLGAQGVQEQIATITELAGGPEALQEALTAAGMEALTSALPSGLVDALGGPAALASTLNSIIGEIINITPPNTPNPGTCSGCNGAQNRDPMTPNGVSASCGTPCGPSGCMGVIRRNQESIRQHITNEFINHKGWLVNVWWKEHILPALTMMNIQFSTVALQQVTIIGSFFDAKHQLETQRLLQELSAEAYKDYTPSEGLCEFGTNTRSLASSTQKSNLTYQTIANRQLTREVRGKDTLSSKGLESDKANRRAQFISTYCDKSNNSNALNYLCASGSPTPARLNKDINYTRSFDSPLTLNIDMSANGSPTDEQEDIFALSANLYAHDVLPIIAARELANGNGDPLHKAYDYMNFRSVAAKRSVGMNSFAAIAGLKSSGDEEVAPFLRKAVTELGVPDDEINFVLGETPSYHAQMEVLTKKLYQNPVFYTELYDKPVNVRRKGVTLRAINLMQDRDIYNSLLRSEAILAVTLETMLEDEHERVITKLNNLPIVDNKMDTVAR